MGILLCHTPPRRKTKILLDLIKKEPHHIQSEENE